MKKRYSKGPFRGMHGLRVATKMTLTRINNILTEYARQGFILTLRQLG